MHSFMVGIKSRVHLILYTLLVVSLVLGVQIQANAAQNVQAVQLLDQGKWAPATYKQVQSMIDKYGIKNAKYNPKKKPYAVFDWDNTSIMNDTEEALFVYQINNLMFKLTPEEFDEIVSKNVPAGEFSKDYINADGQRVTLEAITSDLSADYQYLYENFKGLKGDKSLEEVQATDYFKDFQAKLYFLYEAINDTHGSSVGYPWVLYFFTNMTVEEVQAMAEASNDANLGMAIKKVTWTSPATRAGKAGVISASHVSGIRLTPEISNLMNTLRANGIDVYVVSASMQEVVKVFATLPKYGYNVAKENVIGMQLEIENGKIKAQYKANYPLTVGHGKTEVIQAQIAKKRGYGPLFVAGDSNGDYEMMTEFADTKLVLVINRLKGGKIGQVAAKAVEQMKKPNPRYVLQGRNENSGQWVPSESTIKLGMSELQLQP